MRHRALIRWDLPDGARADFNVQLDTPSDYDKAFDFKAVVIAMAREIHRQGFDPMVKYHQSLPDPSWESVHWRRTDDEPTGP
jgi:hypothetical protein